MKPSLTTITLLFLCCTLILSSQFLNVGCAQEDASHKCLACHDRFYLDQQSRICFPVNPLCLTYKKSNGQCTSCYNGFSLINGFCVYEAPQNNIPHCSSYDSQGNCLKCEVGYFLSEKICKVVDPYCFAYTSSGECSKCFVGYTIVTNQEGIAVCTLIHNCQLFSEDSSCYKCEDGYELKDGLCEQKQEQDNCKVYSLFNRCQECKDGYVLTTNYQCYKISPLCSKYNSLGVCQSCEPSFILFEGECYPFDEFDDHEYDPFCAKFSDHVCVQCATDAYFGPDGKCKQVSSLCQTFNKQNGECYSCYEGYRVEHGQCVEFHADLDPNCHKFENSVCVQCSKGAFMNSNGVCILVDTQCKEVSENGKCVTCYPGYVLSPTAQCMIDDEFHCYEWYGGQCVKCARGYYLKDNRCTLIDPLCKEFDFVTRTCLHCYQGYGLYLGQCINNEKLPSNIKIKGNHCAILGQNGECEKCSVYYYLDYEGYCKEVSPYCKTYHDRRGYCTSCYLGYKLNRYGECTLRTN